MRVLTPNLLVLFVFLLVNNLHAQDTSVDTLDAAEETQTEAGHNIMLAAVKSTDMEQLLDNSGPFTFFAPSDAAIQRLSLDKINELLHSGDKQQLKYLLSYHIVAGQLTASKILRALCKGEGKASFTTIQGKKLEARLQGTDIVLTDSLGNTARIVNADVRGRNGVVHEIDSVFVPSQM
ncbi:MAG: fasciclin domain-containing protein [Bacteroidota bacterium]